MEFGSLITAYAVSYQIANYGITIVLNTLLYCEGQVTELGDLVGHGIGRKLHEDPSVPNFGRAGHGVKLAAGMTLAVEPMVNEGGYEVLSLEDDWTVVTADGSLVPPCLGTHNTSKINFQNAHSY